MSGNSGMILNCHELLSIVHLPSASVRSPRLKRDGRKTKAVHNSVLELVDQMTAAKGIRHFLSWSGNQYSRDLPKSA